MRRLILAPLAILLALEAVAIAPANAQKYDSTSPVCKRNYRWGGEDTDCGYTSMAQCQASASGLAAMCIDNPYYAGPPIDRRPMEPGRRPRPVY
ncbi:MULTISPECIES: DUF3551 domain-containing protein [unclassified Bradyrhizobium]|uniref:DUF3551 domain-containing protein n=1 Tax=unclassified Bradyrhizobium TaxID=2631580 RepID=UPI0003FABDCC|nr:MULTISPECIES: DUF3551 domain-containing protein [unclassified Bradyrhizobium]QIG92316.1 DUF3551 domain-containing protein [Bradyrhizobium sp. 6(2017)]